MKKIIPILAVYIFIGWGVLIIQNPNLFFLRFPFHILKQIQESEPSKPFIYDDNDKLAAKYIASGRQRDAIDVLLETLNRDAIYDDDTIIKNTSFDRHVNTDLIRRYLHGIDILSLIFRLGESAGIQESEMTRILSPYMNNIHDPQSLRDHVVSLEYRLYSRRFEGMERSFKKFKKYLHSKSWNTSEQLPFLYYYPYLKSRYLTSIGKRE